MNKLIDELNLVIKSAVVRAGYDEKYANVKLSDRPDLCEYQCNTGLLSAKLYKDKPINIAKKIADELLKDAKVTNVSAVMPGFVNFDVSEAYLRDYLTEMSEHNCEFVSDSPKVIVLDYGGPNVAKALHIGHLRSAVIGEALKNIARALGHRVIADVHLGDYGLQMGLIITELKIRKPQLPYFRDDFSLDKYADEIRQAPFTIEELGEIYPYASSKSKQDEQYYAMALEATSKLQEGHLGYQAIFKHIVNVSVSDLKKNYERLNVSFDLWLGESDAKPYIPDMLDYMIKNNYARSDEGALVIDVAVEDDKREIPPCLIQKSDGSSLYATTDLATIIQRKQDFDMDRVIYVVDKRQELHFVQVFRAAKKCKLVDENVEFDFVGFGTICGSDGKPLKSRDGGVMTLKSLLDDTAEAMRMKLNTNDELNDEQKAELAEMISISAIKYADLSNQTTKDYIFNSNKFTSYEGNTGPYILYSLVRINSIIDKCGDLSKVIKDYDADNEISNLVLNTELLDIEKKLMSVLSRYFSALESAYDELAPGKICAYLYELAETFNKFYHDVKVVSESDSTRKAGYISLLLLTRHIMKKGLSLLAIEAPQRM